MTSAQQTATPPTAAPAGIEHSEYHQRREAVLSELGDAIGVIFAGDADANLQTSFRPHPHFEYLTGVTDEPGAVLVLDPNALSDSRRSMLFLGALNPELEHWDGIRLTVGEALRARTGVQSVFRTYQLPRYLTESVRRTRTLACLHPLAAYNQPVSPDLKLFRDVAERIPGAEIVDRSDVIADLRAVKSAAEIAMVEHAVQITEAGFDALMQSIRPGMSEFDGQELLEHTYRSRGSRGAAYPTIVGAGVNSTVLHYQANDQTIADGDLLCVDSGAIFGGYAADITRTIPADGTFTQRQREIYDIVLEAELAAIEAAKPGVRIVDLHKAALAVIKKAGYGDAFTHGIGHHLGLEVHDITPDGELKPGNIITIEPGIYLTEEEIGVRIEDDILITEDGNRNLSAMIPKTAEDVEAAMAR